MNRKLILMTCVGFLTAAPVFAGEDEHKDDNTGGAGAAVVAISPAEQAKQLRDMHLTAENMVPVLEKQNGAFLAGVRRACDGFSKSILDSVAADKKGLETGAKAAVAAARQGLIARLLEAHGKNVHDVLIAATEELVQDFMQRVEEILAEDTSAFAEHVEELGDQAAEARLAARGK